MKHKFLGHLLLALSLLSEGSSAEERLRLVSSHVEGLPLHLMSIGIDDLKGKDVIDLKPVFKRLHVIIPADGSIIYDTRSGMLIRNLPQMSHDYLETVLDDIYGLGNSVAITEAYLGLLKPLSDKERVDAVMSAGFPLDPIIESLIDRIRLSRLAEGVDSSYPDYKPFLYLLPDKAKEASESALAILLGEKVNELERQLKIVGPVLDEMQQSGPPASPAPPPNGTTRPKKGQSSMEQPIHPAGGNGGPEPAKPKQP